MKITYLYNSGFLIEHQGTGLIIDYYPGPSHMIRAAQQEVLANYFDSSPEYTYVFCSHAHYDHFSPDIFSWRYQSNLKYILSDDVFVEGREDLNVAFLGAIEEYEDDRVFVRAFGSTDEGVSFLIRLDGRTLFHAGDLNNWHWREEASPEEAKAYETAYLLELGKIRERMPCCEAAFFPLDPRLGREFFLGAQQFMEAVRCTHLFPMHFTQDPNKLEKFVSIAQQAGVSYHPLTETGMSVSI